MQRSRTNCSRTNQKDPQTILRTNNLFRGVNGRSASENKTGHLNRAIPVLKKVIPVFHHANSVRSLARWSRAVLRWKCSAYIMSEMGARIIFLRLADESKPRRCTCRCFQLPPQPTTSAGVLPRTRLAWPWRCRVSVREECIHKQLTSDYIDIREER